MDGIADRAGYADAETDVGGFVSCRDGRTEMDGIPLIDGQINAAQFAVGVPGVLAQVRTAVWHDRSV
jgi:hypothetical protein